MSQLQRLMIADSQCFEQQIALTEEQQHYLYRVLRLRSGDRFIAIDAQGQWWLTQLQAEACGKILAAIPVETELPLELTLLIALPKTGLDEVIRQATEIGVRRIVPIFSQRSLLKPSAQKFDRWQRIAQEAAEQSERQRVPEILAPQTWSTALQTWNATVGDCYFCAARGCFPHLLSCLLNRSQLHPAPVSVAPAPTALFIAIGPEGGWTEAEMAEAIAVGYQPVSLGARILRSVTAPLVALSLLAAVLESDLARSSLGLPPLISPLISPNRA